MRKKTLQIFLLVSMILGLPVLGIALRGKPLSPYFAFPPAATFVHHAPFSWKAFGVYALFIVLWVTPFFLQGMRKPSNAAPSPRHPFPWWGGAAVALLLCAWVLAWTRFPWFRPLQAHTFTPLWLAYILLANALTLRRSGRCLMLDHPARFFLLFPASAAFWWSFEYLNRFVQNWQYAGADFGPWQYFLCATLSFSTVLPAVMSTREWLLTFPRIRQNFAGFLPLNLPHPRLAAFFILLPASAGLASLGLIPDHLYALVWVSPLLILVCLQALMGESTVFSPLNRGDWSNVASCALAALICGFLWEMWNHLSLARWTYSIPLVQRFHVFEMPILGYAGYLPFGVLCGVVSEMVPGKR